MTRRFDVSLCKVLQKQGYPVAVAADGRQAIALVVDHQEDFGLIIIDLVMPESEGIETICCLRKRRPNIKLLAVSGDSRDACSIRCLDAPPCSELMLPSSSQSGRKFSLRQFERS